MIGEPHSEVRADSARTDTKVDPMPILRSSTIPLGVIAAGLLVSLAACATPANAPAPESAPVTAYSAASDTSTLVGLDVSAGQLPENIVSAGDNVVVTFAASRQVASVAPDGEVDILGTLPTPAGGGVTTPVLGFPLATGLALVDGSYFALYATGEADTTGLWELGSDGTFTLVAPLPATSLPNGLTFDEKNDRFLATDSALGVIYSIERSGEVQTWSDDPQLAMSGFLGANGIQLHDGEVYVSNLDAGTILRIEVGDDGAAGSVRVVASDLAGIDDFAFTGRGDQIIATLNPTSEVVLVDGESHTTVLSEDDGLTNPTSVLVRGDTIYVASAAYVNQDSPNLLTATLSAK